MKNMNTTLEIPEGSKATIQGKVIDGKNYLVVEVEQEPELKEGDLAIFWNYEHRAIIALYHHFAIEARNLSAMHGRSLAHNGGAMRLFCPARNYQVTTKFHGQNGV